MPIDRLMRFLDTFQAACAARKITGTVVFHGGEPLLMGKEYLRNALSHSGFRDGVLRPILQTNGTVFDEEWLELFLEYKVRIGVSLDGPKEVHDAVRKTIGGKGTHDRIKGNVARMREADLDVGGLCVVNPTADGGQCLRHLISLGFNRIDLLPPISSHAAQKLDPVDLAGVATFMRDRFYCLG